MSRDEKVDGLTDEEFLVKYKGQLVLLHGRVGKLVDLKDCSYGDCWHWHVQDLLTGDETEQTCTHRPFPLKDILPPDEYERHLRQFDLQWGNPLVQDDIVRRNARDTELLKKIFGDNY
jgi:hypothetical protein